MDLGNQYDIELRVRNYLNTRSIILIDSTYDIEDNLMKLSETIGTELNIESTIIFGILQNLQKKAQINIANINRHKNENVFTLKIHFPRTKKTENLTINEFIDCTGAQLKQQIIQYFNLGSVVDINMIFRGSIIKDSELITDKGIKNNSKILALETTGERLDSVTSLDKSKSMASYLSERAKDNRFKLRKMNIDITNQNGEVLKLSQKEKSLLTYGLSMHECATHYIMNEEFQEALLHCLEADQAFKESQYSNKVDNVALLQLDIVWCYYKLQNMDDITEANGRLSACEERMRTCYGEDNERIQKIRAKTTFEGVPEMVHLFRLYVLFGVLKYYQNDTNSAIRYFEKARHLHSELSVPNATLETVMMMGFERKESLEALKVSKDVNNAVEYIYKRRDQNKKVAKQNKVRKQRIAIADRYGPTSSGARLNIDLLEEVIRQSPGVDPALCLVSVLHNDNDPLVCSEDVFNNVDMLKKLLDQRRNRGYLCTVDLTYEGLVEENKDIKEILDIVKCTKSGARKLLRQFNGDKERALSVIFDENFSQGFEHLFRKESVGSSTSEGDDNDDAGDDPLKPNAGLEEEIIDLLANQDLEKKYNHNDLHNEIEVFNKFADLLRIPIIENLHSSF